ncbi:MAG: hypothetical protein COU81_02750 [Candidatus Portnoybacteria bacterium CG10_big_fil_rev_8_21_14_0_10_36_7]|uniref:Uncharacterized protein n=1 Tax=Candidatus Portnoybacteria bacterium CG10_big_fil_rev_8_21_14_0_10_36_7 TaxID=1974812 RepID=A0A2M8KDQ8_9BACT|nr:MAG: hypothetical protein COU81_02750 [Candidatus Portnoybacteria bacterium CG10_big_fil_rev_8_21_14_0_10_36_7]
MKKNTNTIILIGLVVCVILFVYYLSNGKNNSWNNLTGNNASSTIIGGNSTDDKTRAETGIDAKMDYIANNIASLSPANPVLGGSWYVIRFWFANDDNVYVEYEDGHVLRRILVEIISGEKILANGDSQPLPYEYEVRAYFEPGESDWTIKDGSDTMFGKPLKLYEFDQDSDIWTKRN